MRPISPPEPAPPSANERRGSETNAPNCTSGTAAMLRFLSVLFAPDDIIEIRLIWPDREVGKSPIQRWTTLAALEHDAALPASLAAWNAKGWGVYVGASPRKHDGGSKAADVAMARALFVDFDHLSLDEARRQVGAAGLPDPTIWVLSGHGAHCYWVLSEPVLDLARWAAHQKALIAVLPGADKAIHDAPRVMRLPGFVNTKPPAAPCGLVEAVSQVYPLVGFPAPRAIDPPGSAVRVVVRTRRASGTSPYGMAALRNAAERVAATPVGERNHALNRGAFGIGSLVGGREIDREQAAEALLSAALQSGLGEVEAKDVIDRALSAGEQRPRVAPPRPPALTGEGWRCFIPDEWLAPVISGVVVRARGAQP